MDTAPLRLLISESTDPWFNLAVEDTIFRHLSPSQRVLFLWRNADTVVIGRAQNPWRECNTRKMEEDEIKLARRQSGGGAVFHDLGNTNFTFMAGKPDYNRHVSTEIVLTALHSLDIPCYASGRNDLLLEFADGPRKVSGSAYRETADRGFHHGTLLIDAELDRLTNYLTPDPKKLKTKGITSVRSRVANMVEWLPSLDHDMLCEALSAAFFNYYGQRAATELIAPNRPLDLPGFDERFALQSSWDWNFGQAPQFDHELSERFEWGGVELHLNVERGHITHTQLFSDSLNPDPWLLWAESLVGVRYEPQAVTATLTQMAEGSSDLAKQATELMNWLSHALA
ncbi:lipoate--protein ligase [Pokkaliibacter plantistimulans]|uniref:lipoate--protein ligase n=1 Tax=Proteobacteria bacterium 228 TaxID=2083153 RepID=A0A2S5KRA1_9PROT|nr:lipoate--protein ligase [Pokkaliibacter plantistimulans]PPC77185.1 lipoate--protein ligase [Pokkaliibacter plantistimulans]